MTGWKCCPRETTDDMANAAELGAWEAQKIWQAMYDAAPAAPPAPADYAGLEQVLRALPEKLRRTPTPIIDIVPTLQRAADALTALLRERDALRESLAHMNWCATCAQGSWDDCEEGRKALVLIGAAP